jgi:microsomal epoxide hydrolase
MKLEISPFSVQVSETDIDDLRIRLARTRWPDQLPDAGWGYGAERGYVQALCDYWRTDYDWRGFEGRLNAYPQFLTEIDGERVHFYHVRSPETSARPLILCHGWPGSVVEFLQVIGPLSDPVRYGGDPRDAFHLVVPSLPGYGFSGPTRHRGVDKAKIARMFDTLMLDLGYDRYFAQGGDWGAIVTSAMAEARPEHVAALHINMAPADPPDPAQPMAGLSAAEAAEWSRFLGFMQFEFAYSQIQSSRPQTLAYGLSDSPAGLAGWLIEKFKAWSDCGDDIERDFSRDGLLDNISTYWLTGTINSSIRLYYETNGPGAAFRNARVKVPTGVARFAGEPYRWPRPWVEAAYNVADWREIAQGGHFAAMQRPQEFLAAVRGFFRTQR